MTALPGTPQYINTMPMKYFHTNIYAAPVIGLISSVIMGVLGVLWLNYRSKTLIASGEGYGNHIEEKLEEKELPNLLISFAPILTIFILNYYK